MWKVFLHIAMISIIVFSIGKIVTGNATLDEWLYLLGAIGIELADIIEHLKK